MVRAKNYEIMSTFVKVIQKKLWPPFFPDTVYLSHQRQRQKLHNIWQVPIIRLRRHLKPAAQSFIK